MRSLFTIMLLDARDMHADRPTDSGRRRQPVVMVQMYNIGRNLWPAGLEATPGAIG